VRARSTDYCRTAQSCQYLLRGLLGADGLLGAHRGGVAVHVPEEAFINPFDAGISASSLKSSNPAYY
jgi:hypothetical protein